MRPSPWVDILFEITILAVVVCLQWGSKHAEHLLKEEESTSPLIPTD